MDYGPESKTEFFAAVTNHFMLTAIICGALFFSRYFFNLNDKGIAITTFIAVTLFILVVSAILSNLSDFTGKEYIQSFSQSILWLGFGLFNVWFFQDFDTNWLLSYYSVAVFCSIVFGVFCLFNCIHSLIFPEFNKKMRERMEQKEETNE